MIKPSLIGHFISGLVLLWAMIILYQCFQNNELQGIELAHMLILVSIGLALHSSFHLLGEAYFRFNPFEGRIVY